MSVISQLLCLDVSHSFGINWPVKLIIICAVHTINNKPHHGPIFGKILFWFKQYVRKTDPIAHYIQTNTTIGFIIYIYIYIDFAVISH